MIKKILKAQRKGAKSIVLVLLAIIVDTIILVNYLEHSNMIQLIFGLFGVSVVYLTIASDFNFINKSAQENLTFLKDLSISIVISFNIAPYFNTVVSNSYTYNGNIYIFIVGMVSIYIISSIAAFVVNQLNEL